MSGRMHDPLTRLPAPPGEWTTRAACHGAWDLLDPPEGQRTAWVRDAALALCQACPVVGDCREWVLGLPPSADPGGVTGGMTEYRRGQERGRRRRTARKAARS